MKFDHTGETERFIFVGNEPPNTGSKWITVWLAIAFILGSINGFLWAVVVLA